MPFEPLLTLPWWAYVLVTLALTHTTIVATTIFLHRHQAHRALDLHPAVSHFFRFWLWLTTAMVTREWVAVHRKHHAHVETAGDPHSPRVHGIHRVLWLGALLYHREAARAETLEKYGHGTPDDWLERTVYTRRTYLGPTALLILHVLVFGPLAGGTIWLVQMLWIPFWAAGVINGLGHWLGYRNYEVSDASRNIVPWGVIIGGEELHNNHHAYASSARFALKPWEFDLGWAYIRALCALGLARVRKLPPVAVHQPGKRQCDMETVRAVVSTRFQVMAEFAQHVVHDVCRDELKRADRVYRAGIVHARRLMAREISLLDESSRARLSGVLDRNARLRTVYAMKERLQAIWSRSTHNPEVMIAALEEWCRSAEASGIEALQRFSERLRGYTLAPNPA